MMRFLDGFLCVSLPAFQVEAQQTVADVDRHHFSYVFLEGYTDFVYRALLVHA